MKKPKPPGEKYKKYMIVLAPEQIEWLNENIQGSKAEFIRNAVQIAIEEFGYQSSETRKRLR